MGIIKVGLSEKLSGKFFKLSQRTMLRQKGVSLIEVLAALLVFAVGVVGAIALQTHSASDAKYASHTAQATNIAYDLGERFRGNQSVRAAYLDANWGSAATAASVGSCVNAPVGDATGQICTAGNLATADINEIKLLAETLLPQGQVLMDEAACAPQICVRVAWGGIDPANCIANGITNSCVQLTYQ